MQESAAASTEQLLVLCTLYHLSRLEESGRPQRSTGSNSELIGLIYQDVVLYYCFIQFVTLIPEQL